MEWNIGKSGQRCARCDKSFVEREEYYSALYDEKPEFVRRDYCLECWPHVNRDEVFSFWKTRVPTKEEAEKKFVDDEVVLNFFVRLENEQDQVKRNFRYVLALYLMRKRLLKFRDVKRGEGGEALVLYCPREEREFEVYNPQLTEEEIEAVTEEVGQILNVRL